MSLLAKTIVQAFADSLELGSLTPEAADGLAPHLEFRLREIVQVDANCRHYLQDQMGMAVCLLSSLMPDRMPRSSCATPSGRRFQQRTSTAPWWLAGRRCGGIV